eukprot:Skav202677  [mRNA]  locus=scaffold1791:614698:615306:- [translate_table: standard]
MMREELTNGLQEMEGKLLAKMEGELGKVKEELAQEKEGRKQLEMRVAQLEMAKHQENVEEVEDVDKTKVVIGGFSELDAEEAEQLVTDALSNVRGFQEVHVTNPTPSVVFAHFDTPANAMKLIRSQKWNPNMLESKLWASENRSQSERRSCKIVSKVKKYLIEYEGMVAKNIAVNYKTFSVKVRDEMSGWIVPSQNVAVAKL